MKVTYYGHSCFAVETAGKTLLFDPFITPNPLAASVDIASLKPDFILLSHGHFDHVTDVETIARASGATIVAGYEVVEWFGNKGIENRIHMNSGGSCNLEFGRVTFTTAIHSSSLPDGSYGGQPGGFRVETAEGAFYYSGDTALTRDIDLIAAAGPLKFAALCIGDHFTMGARDAATAAEWLGCREVLGVHYDTFPPITIDREAAKQAFELKGARLHLPGIGESVTF
jgi:L-ascorbate metabolism protein UlaG (beta-lactamase superfamily)